MAQKTLEEMIIELQKHVMKSILSSPKHKSMFEQVVQAQQMQRPGPSLYGQEAASQPGAQQFNPLLGGAGASIVQNPDATMNYQKVDPRSIGQSAPPVTDPVMQLLDMLRKSGLRSLK